MFSEKTILLILSACFLLLGCDYSFPTQTADPTPIASGEEKVENFVVIGGSITSGIMDGAFYKRGQMRGYPNLFGDRLDSAFQEDVYGILTTNNEQGYNLTASEQGNPRSKFRLTYRGIDTDYPVRVTDNGENIETFAGNIDTVSNFSVPHLRSYQVHDYDSLSENKFYQRFSAQVSQQSLVETVIAKEPSLVLLSLGTGDVDPYIINGASGRIDPPDNDIRAEDATPMALFEQSAQNAVDEILNNTQADIILPTIIDPTEFFYFTTLKWHFTVSEIEGQLGTAISHYESFNADVQELNARNNGKRRPVVAFDFEPGKQWRAKVFVDDQLPYAEADDGTVIPKYRQMSYKDHMLFSAEEKQYASINSDKTFATTDPADDKYVITVGELELIRGLIEDFNNVLKSVANNYDRVKLLDLNTKIEDVKEGLVNYDGVVLHTGFDQNTIVSSDGYSLNSKGQALLANELIKLLNGNYGTRFRDFDVNSFEGNQVEMMFDN